MPSYVKRLNPPPDGAPPPSSICQLDKGGIPKRYNAQDRPESGLLRLYDLGYSHVLIVELRQLRLLLPKVQLEPLHSNSGYAVYDLEPWLQTETKLRHGNGEDITQLWNATDLISKECWKWYTKIDSWREQCPELQRELDNARLAIEKTYPHWKTLREKR